MSPVIAEATDALHEYTEPINSRVFRKADALPEQRRSAFIALRNKYQSLMVTNFAFHPDMIGGGLSSVASELPTLPLRDPQLGPDESWWVGGLPDDVLDAVALRPLMERLISHSENAIAEFDAVFGERAYSSLDLTGGSVIPPPMGRARLSRTCRIEVVSRTAEPGSAMPR